MRWVNKTGKTIVIVCGRQEVTLEPVAPMPFVQVLKRDIGDGPVDCPIYKTTYGEVEGLPPEVGGVCYIVNRIVAAANPRSDLFFLTDILPKESSDRLTVAKSLSRSVSNKEWEDESYYDY